ncbi:ribonuclease P [Coccidioides immitis H538.4]|uniref:Ribonuclease P n=1 Tax=Coccidioides immitis H538.4 TaxID=396776 RepID=A0A0J8S531_COCIT|nr:ribonuclease P [Coccidioides immitis H538.4]
MPTELYVLLHQLRSTHIHDYHSVEPAYYYGVHPTQCPEEGIVGSIPILSLYGTMTFYDLNVPYTSSDANVVHTLHFLAELGYTTVALSQSLSTKFPPNQTPPVMPTNIPKSMTLLTRLNLTVSEPSQNPRLTTLAQSYSLLAIRPTNEKSLMQACNNLDCDIISLDLAVRLPFHFKFKTLSSAVARGVRFEICYSPGLTGSGPEARRNLISNAISLVRATRGPGHHPFKRSKASIGCKSAIRCDKFGMPLGNDAGNAKDALCDEARKVVALARMKRSSWRGTVDVVIGGNKLSPSGETALQAKRGTPAGTPQSGNGVKRKASEDGIMATSEPRVSKRELKRMSKKVRLENCDNDKLASPSIAQP